MEAMHPRRLLALIAVLVLLIDLVAKTVAVKNMAYGERIEVLGPFSLVLIRNPGAAFSMATGLTWVLTLVALAVVVWIVRMGSKLTSMWWALGLGLVLGGALGNLVDRIRQGYVTDFINFPHWPAFNVADMCITGGVVALVLVLELGGRAADD
jgi:signal peptidase II